MRRIKALLLALAFLVVSLGQQSCMGSFQLTNNLYSWNKTQVKGKWGSELVFVALVIIPVYEVCLLADGIVLNSIEFWSGSNPVTMKAGEKEMQIVQHQDDTYQLSVSQNIVSAEKIAGENAGEKGEFIWDEQSETWTFIGEGKKYELKEGSTDLNE